METPGANAPSPAVLPVGELFSMAWRSFKQRALVLLLILAIGLGTAALLAILSAFALQWGPRALQVTVAVIVGAALFFLTYCAEYIAVVEPQTGVVEAFRAASRRFAGFTGMFFLLGFVTLLGFVLLIIPGIIAMIFFSFVPFIYLKENAGIVESFKRSVAYVRIATGPVALRLLAALGISVALNIIPVIGGLLAFAYSAFLLLFAYHLYENLKTLRSGTAVPPPEEEHRPL